MRKITMANMALCALFAAMSAVLSQIMIPIGPVPVVLTHISIFLAGGLLGAKYGAVSQIVFVLLGAVGAPVFSGLSGGAGIILGQRGGFIIGYILCAFLTGVLIERSGRSMKLMPLAMLPGTVVIYILGALWYMFITNAEPAATLAVCVIPFIPGDIAKIIISAFLIKKLDPHVRIIVGKAA